MRKFTDLALDEQLKLDLVKIEGDFDDADDNAEEETVPDVDLDAQIADLNTQLEKKIAGLKRQ